MSRYAPPFLILLLAAVLLCCPGCYSLADKPADPSAAADQMTHVAWSVGVVFLLLVLSLVAQAWIPDPTLRIQGLALTTGATVLVLLLLLAG